MLIATKPKRCYQFEHLYRTTQKPAKKINEWVLNKAGVKRELLVLDTVKVLIVTP